MLTEVHASHVLNEDELEQIKGGGLPGWFGWVSVAGAIYEIGCGFADGFRHGYR